MTLKRSILGAILLVSVGFIAIVVVIASQEQACILSNMDGYFALPASARNIRQQSSENTRSCTHRMKFDLTPADLDGFISTTLIKGNLSSTTLPSLIGGILTQQQYTGWQLHSIDSYLSGEAQGSDQNYLDEQFVFIDTTNPRRFTVYLVTKKNWV